MHRISQPPYTEPSHRTSFRFIAFHILFPARWPAPHNLWTCLWTLSFRPQDSNICGMNGRSSSRPCLSRVERISARLPTTRPLSIPSPLESILAHIHSPPLFIYRGQITSKTISTEIVRCFLEIGNARHSVRIQSLLSLGGD